MIFAAYYLKNVKSRKLSLASYNEVRNGLKAVVSTSFRRSRLPVLLTNLSAEASKARRWIHPHAQKDLGYSVEDE